MEDIKELTKELVESNINVIYVYDNGTASIRKDSEVVYTVDQAAIDALVTEITNAGELAFPLTVIFLLLPLANSIILDKITIS